MDGNIRLRAYYKLGFTKGALEDEFVFIREEALKYFENCQEILELDKIKYNFSEDEKAILRMNNVPVFEQ